MFYSWWVDNLETIGSMTDMALYYLYQYYSGGGHTKCYFEAYNVLGDPSIKIWNGAPPDYPPEIKNVSISPSVQNPDGWVNISCQVIDDNKVDKVKVNITYPDGTFINQTMSYDNNESNEFKTYYYYTNYSEVGIYNIFIWANDTNDNQNISERYLLMIGQLFNITDLSLGWNLISLPFNQSIDKSNIIINIDGINYTWNEAASIGLLTDVLFGWNRSFQSYFFADILEPGNGYWLFSFEYCNIFTLGYNSSFNGHITNVEPYWNIVSIPKYQTLNKTDIIVNYNGSDYIWEDAVTIGYINDIIFGWGGPQLGYSFCDIFIPGYSYWIYAYQSCKLKQ
jgi:hypothetical protein